MPPVHTETVKPEQFPVAWQSWAALTATSLTILGTVWPKFRRFVAFVWRVLTSFLTSPMAISDMRRDQDRRHHENVDRLDAIQTALFENTQMTREALSGRLAFTADATGACTWASDAWCDLVAMSLERALGNGWTASIDSSDRDRVVTEWGKCVAEKRPFIAQYRYRVGDTGKTVLVETSAAPVKNHRNQVTTFIGRVRRLD